MNNLNKMIKMQLDHVSKFDSTSWFDKKYFNVDENDQKILSDRLLPFVGEYKVNPTVRPEWFIEAMYEFNYFIDENLKDEELKEIIIKEVETYTETKKLPENPSWFIRAVDQYQNAKPEDVYNGYFPNGQKIVKFLKKVAELTLGKEVDFLKSNCVKIIESNKPESSTGMKIVITNSAASIMCMSEFFEGGMTSCQQWSGGKNSGNSRKLSNNLSDPNMLLLYVTNGQKSKSMEKYGVIEHEVMKQRMLIRLIKTYKTPEKDGTIYSKKSNKKEELVDIGIMVDRSYPKSDYNNEIYELLNELCEKNGLKFYEPFDYNMSREGGKIQKIFKKVKDPLYAFDAEPYKILSCRSFIGEDKCKAMVSQSICETSCRPISKEICAACTSMFKFNEIVDKKCSKCKECKLTDKAVTCCECPIMNGLEFGYKDNTSRYSTDCLINTNGTIQDMYKVKELVRC